MRLDRNDEALELFNRSLKYCKEIGDTFTEAANIAHIGAIKAIEGDFCEAPKNFDEAEYLLRQSGGREYEYKIADILKRKAHIYYAKKEHDKAIDLFNKAANIFRRFQDKSEESDIMHALSNVYYDKGDFAKSQQCLTRSFQLEVK